MPTLHRTTRISTGCSGTGPRHWKLLGRWADTIEGGSVASEVAVQMSKGFTLVEAIVVVVVFGVLSAILIPTISQRGRQRRQAWADANPNEAFECLCWPKEKEFKFADFNTFVCDVSNLTGYDLKFRFYGLYINLPNGVAHGLTLMEPFDFRPIHHVPFEVQVSADESVRIETANNFLYDKPGTYAGTICLDMPGAVLFGNLVNFRKLSLADSDAIDDKRTSVVTP